MSDKSTFSIAEFGRIYSEEDFNNDQLPESSLETVFLPARAFENLRNFIAENQDESIGTEQSFSVHRSKGRDFIRVKNYVGVIETRDGTILEVLPKIYRSTTEREEQHLEETRRIFLRMLRCLRDSPFVSIDNAHLKSCRFPILEVFISVFLAEMDKLVKQGIRRHYISTEGNEMFLKGRLVFARQMQENLIHPERFYVSYDVFDSNIPQNRLIKSSLLKLAQTSRSIRNQNLIRQFLFILADIPESTDHVRDFSESQSGQSRLLEGYTQLLKWARVFLLNESFTNFKGTHHNKAILFPMERIFEDYVSYGFRCYADAYDVSIQDHVHHLVQKHNGASKFALRPDIVLRDQRNRSSTIIDCKWKLINAGEIGKNYNISQSDMYQLYAYGKKYVMYRCEKLILLYPKSETFTTPLTPFYYEIVEDRCLQLFVVPFDLNCDLETSVNEVMQYQEIQSSV